MKGRNSGQKWADFPLWWEEDGECEYRCGEAGRLDGRKTVFLSQSFNSL